MDQFLQLPPADFGKVPLFCRLPGRLDHETHLPAMPAERCGTPAFPAFRKLSQLR
jgi:hypothetical protein